MDGRLTVLFMGTATAPLDEQKGLRELIDAVERVRTDHPAVLLVLAGGAAHDARLRERLGPPGDGWLMLGPIDAGTRTVLYRSVDIFALPSYAENMPNTVLEAMAAGCAIVATRVGAVPEMLTQGPSGLLIPPHDATALTEALLRLVRDPHLRQQLGRHAAEAATARYDLAAVEQALSAVYGALSHRTATG